MDYFMRTQPFLMTTYIMEQVTSEYSLDERDTGSNEYFMSVSWGGDTSSSVLYTLLATQYSILYYAYCTNTTLTPFLLLQNRTQACTVWRLCVQHIRIVYATFPSSFPWNWSLKKMSSINPSKNSLGIMCFMLCFAKVSVAGFCTSYVAPRFPCFITVTPTYWESTVI